MATKAEVRQRVGEDLSLIPVGGTLESQDQTRIDATFDEVYARLKQQGLAVWASTADVPAEVVPYYVQMMLQKLTLTYSVPAERYQRIQGEAGPDGASALMKIADLITPAYESIYEPVGY